MLICHHASMTSASEWMSKLLWPKKNIRETNVMVLIGHNAFSRRDISVYFYELKVKIFYSFLMMFCVNIHLFPLMLASLDDYRLIPIQYYISVYFTLPTSYEFRLNNNLMPLPYYSWLSCINNDRFTLKHKSKFPLL